MPAGGGQLRPAPDPKGEPPEDDRAGWITAMTAIGVSGPVLKGIVVDRPMVAIALPRAIKLNRLPESKGILKKALFELASGVPTNDVVPITGGTMKVFGKTLTTNGWGIMNKGNNAANAAFLGARMIYATPNLVHALREDGASGLVTTKVGRTGLLATIGQVIELGVYGYAFAKSPGGTGRLGAMMAHPVLSSTPFVASKLIVSAPVALNELGFLDFLDKDDDRSVAKTASDAAGELWNKVPGVG